MTKAAPIEQVRCRQCGNKWYPTAPPPHRPPMCPACRSMRWDKPKRVARVGKS